MSKIKQLDPAILKRSEFENKRSYDNAVWYLEHLNDLVMLHNSGYVIFEGERRMVPDLRATFYTNTDGKNGELLHVLIGAAMLFGHTRDLKKGRIFVSKKEANDFLKTITVVRKTDFHKFLDL